MCPGNPGILARVSLLTRHMREVTLNGQAPSVGRLPATQSMRLDIVLPLRNQTELENFLRELYDPASPSYRRFLTVREFTARFGPSQQDYDAVIRFAKANGFTVVGGSRDGMDVQLEGSVATIETAFHVTMGVYQHPTVPRTFYAPDREPTVDLPFRLWHISGLDNYSIPHPAFRHRNLSEESNAVEGSCPSSSYCASDMRAAYYGGTSLTGSGQTLGLLEYYGYDIADVNTYFTNAGQKNSVPIDGISTDGTSLNCLHADDCDDTEQSIDITQAVSMAPGMTALYVYVGSTERIAVALERHGDFPCRLYFQRQHPASAFDRDRHTVWVYGAACSDILARAPAATPLVASPRKSRERGACRRCPACSESGTRCLGSEST
ncbi:MAG: protease pro-enzyme activation domain-containing protein, partial [Candidatus Binataceae bacterium]